jgi:hypothetical protein
MGAAGNNRERRLRESIESLHNQEEDYQLTCSECILIPKILEIDYYNYSIEYECPKHGYKEENIKEYFELSKQYLYKNNNLEENNDKSQKQIFYYCLKCKNFLCEQCQKNDKHKELIKINDPENKIDIHLNNYYKYCKCNTQLYDNKEINCTKKEENIKKDPQLIKKLNNKISKLKEKKEYRKCMIKLLDKLISMYKKQELNHLINNNIIKASEKINEKKMKDYAKK